MADYKAGIVITGDAQGGIKAIQATDEQLEQLNQQTDKSTAGQRRFSQQTRDTESNMQLMARAAKTLGPLIGGMFTANALRNQIDWGDRLDKLNLRIGASTEGLSEYAYVAERSGVQFDALATALQRQTRRVSESANGMGTASSALKTLGLDARALQQMKPEDQFEAIAKELAGVKDESRQAALAMKIWDTEGVSLLQIVNQGTDAIKGMRQEARDFGRSISREQAAEMATFNDNLTKMSSLAQGAGISFVNELTPALNSNMESLQEWITEAGGAETVYHALTAAAGGYAAMLARNVIVSTTAKIAATVRDRQATLEKLNTDRLAAGAAYEAATADKAKAAAALEAAQANLRLVQSDINAVQASQSAEAADLVAARARRDKAAASLQAAQGSAQELAAERTRLTTIMQSATTDQERAQASRQLTQVRTAQAATHSRIAQAEQALATETAAVEQAAARATVAAQNEVTSAKTRVAAATKAHDAALVTSERTTKAWTAATTLAGRAATVTSGAMALMGGPLGVATIAAGALYLYSTRSSEASQANKDLANSIADVNTPLDDLADKWDTATQAQRNYTLETLQNQLDEQADEIENTANRIGAAFRNYGIPTDLDSYKVLSEVTEQLRAGTIDTADAIDTLRGKFRMISEKEGLAFGATVAELGANLDSGRQRSDQLADRLGNLRGRMDETTESVTQTYQAVDLGSAEWDKYIGKLLEANATLGMTAEQEARYRAQKEGFNAVQTEYAANVAAQGEALREYQRALEQGNTAEAAVQRERLMRLAETQATIQAQFANVEQLNNLLAGVQTSLSGVALSASLAVSNSAGATQSVLEQALADMEARLQRIHANTKVSASKASSATKELANSVKEAQGIYDSLRSEFDPLGTAADGYAKKLKALDLLHKQHKITTGQLALAQNELKKQYQESIDPLQQILDRMDPAAARLRAYKKEVENVRKAGEAAGRSQLEITAAQAQLALEYQKAERAADPYYQRTLELQRQYAGSTIKARELEQAVDDLNRRYNEGDITGNQYYEMLGAVHDEMRDLARKSSPYADEMARSWDEAAKRIDETFADAFTGAFDSFSDFSSQLMDGFKRLLGELAYQATLKPIVVSFTSQAQSALGVPGAPGGSAGGMDLTSIGKTVFNGVRDGFGSINWLGAPTSYGGGFAGNATSGMNVASRGTSWLGGSTSNFSGFNGLASAGTAYVGSQLGNRVGSSVFGKQSNSNYGAMAGSAIGTYFGGPLGAFAGGSIGGALDSLFGSSSKKPFAKTWSGQRDADPMNFYRLNEGNDYWSNTQLGTVGILDKHKVDTSSLKQWVQGIEQADNAIAAMLNDSQLAAARDAVADPSKYKGTDLSRVTEERYNKVIQSVIASSSDMTGKLIGRIGRIQADSIDEQASQLANALQLGRMIDESSGIVRRYAEGVANDLSLNIEQALDSIQSSINNYQLVTTASDRLGLQFDSLSDGAVDAANGIVSLAGGIDAFSQQQQAFFSSFFSEQEQFDRLSQDLTKTFSEAGLALPATTDGVRDLVGSLNLMTDSGRRQNAVVMGNVDALNQYIAGLKRQAEAAREASAAMAKRQVLEYGIDQAVSDSIDGYNARINAIKELESARTQQLNNEMRAIEQLGSLLDSLLLSSQSVLDPAQRLQEAQRQFAEIQVRAERGDTDAVSQLQGASSSYLDAAAAYYGQGSDQYARIFRDVTSGVQRLETQFKASSASLGSLESIQSMALREQQRARDLLANQLGEQVRMVGGLASLADLFAALPADIARALGDAMPGVADSDRAVGGTLNSRFGQASAKYLADNPDVAQAVNNGVFKSAYDHYLQYGQYEANRGGFPKFADGGIASGPTSGYPVELHGTEAVVPLKGGSIPVRISGGRMMDAPAPPPAAMAGTAAAGNRNAVSIEKLLESLQRDNRALREQVAELISFTQMTAENTDATANNTARGATAAEDSVRAARTTSRSTV